MRHLWQGVVVGLCGTTAPGARAKRCALAGAVFGIVEFGILALVDLVWIPAVESGPPLWELAAATVVGAVIYAGVCAVLGILGGDGDGLDGPPASRGRREPTGHTRQQPLTDSRSIMPGRGLSDPKARRFTLTALALGAGALAACATEPPDGVTDLAGAWVARDTFEIRYHGTDGLDHAFRYANDYPVQVRSVDDSTYFFRVIGGTQTQISSVGGGAGDTVRVSGVELDGSVRVRGDTAFIELLGRLPLGGRDDRVLDSRQVLSDAVCDRNVGPTVPRSPPPVCIETHHWTR